MKSFVRRRLEQPSSGDNALHAQHAEERRGMVLEIPDHAQHVQAVAGRACGDRKILETSIRSVKEQGASTRRAVKQHQACGEGTREILICITILYRSLCLPVFLRSVFLLLHARFLGVVWSFEHTCLSRCFISRFTVESVQCRNESIGRHSVP